MLVEVRQIGLRVQIPTCASVPNGPIRRGAAHAYESNALVTYREPPFRTAQTL